MTVVEVEKLCVSYRSGRGRRQKVVVGLDDVSLSVEQGQTLGVVGESGSGKSTLGRAIAGLEGTDSGRLTVAGFDIRASGGSVPREFWDSVQMVWQDPLGSLTPTMKVGALLAEAYRRGRSRSRQETDRRLGELMEMVQLPGTALDRYAHELSGGQRQRVAIARAFAAEPSVVVLDEAVSALDLLTQGQILQLLLDIQREVGVTYIFISHDLGVVSKIADYTAVLYQGNLMEFGPTRDVIDNPANPYTRELMVSTLTVDSPGDDPIFESVGMEPPYPEHHLTKGVCPYLWRCVDAVEVCTKYRVPVRTVASEHISQCHRS